MIAFGDQVSDPVGSGGVLAIALSFFILGCFLLVLTGGTLGALHAFAGFIVLAIVAALNQLLPVLTHAPVARPTYVIGIALSFALGFALLIAGFYGAPTFLAAAVVLGVSALTWAAWNIIRLFSGREEVQTRALMACAVVSFAIAAVIGVAMAGSFASSWSFPVGTFAPLHATVAIIGFASLLIVAISYRFVPMFSVSHGTAYGRRITQWVAVGSFVIVAAFLHSPVVLRLGLAGLLIAALSIGLSHQKTLRTRLRARLDVSLRYGYVAWIYAIVALILAIVATWQSRFDIAVVTLAILGWISITILGYAYKVVGFLAWQMAKERDPLAQLPALSTAVNLPTAYVGLTLLALGAAVCAVCSVVKPEHVQIGYSIYAAGGVCAVAALSRLTAIYVFRKSINESTTCATG